MDLYILESYLLLCTDPGRNHGINPVPDLGPDPARCVYDSSEFNSDGRLHAESCAISPTASLL